MAYAALMSARQDYSSIGSSVASMQENAIEVAGQNEESQTFYESLTNQLETAGLQETIPAIPGVIGAAYAIKKAYSSLGTLKESVLSGVEKGKALLAAKGQEGLALKDRAATLVQNTQEELTTTARTAVSDTVAAGENLVNTGRQVVQDVTNQVVDTGRQALETGTQLVQDVGSQVVETATRVTASATESFADLGDEASAIAARSLGGTMNLPRQLGANLPTIETTFDEDAILPYRPTLPTVSTAAEDVVDEPLAAVNSVTSRVGGSVRSTVAGLEQEMTAFRPSASLPTIPSVDVPAMPSLPEMPAIPSVEMPPIPSVPSVETLMPRAAETLQPLRTAAEDAIQPLTNAAENVTRTVGTALTEGADIATAGAKLATDTAVGLADIALPVIGEVGLVGLGIWQAVEGFKDLFNHPTVPTAAPVPVVANIAQSFQSGI